MEAIHEEAFEDGTERQFDESENPILKLREKVLTQARQLRELERYKSLCEERILDLSPLHPLPVRAKHLGKSFLHKKNQETRISFPCPSSSIPADELIKLYSDVYSSYNTICRDKELLEKSLSDEIINSEEQRIFIGILKETIEFKLSKTGPSEVVENQSLPNNSEGQLTSKVGQLERTLKAKATECERNAGEKEEQLKNFSQAIEALSLADEELKRLEEEKSSLLDYVDIHSRTEQQLLTENESLKEEITKHKETLGSITREHQMQFEGIKLSLLAKTQENSEIAHELSVLQSAIQDQQKQHENGISSRETISSELRVWKQEIKHLQLAKLRTSATLKEAQRTIENSTKEIHSKTIKHSRAQARLRKLETELKTRETELEELKIQYTEDIETTQKRSQGEITRLERLYSQAISREKASLQEATGLKQVYENDKQSLEHYKEHLISLVDTYIEFEAEIIPEEKTKDHLELAIRSLGKSFLSQKKASKSLKAQVASLTNSISTFTAKESETSLLLSEHSSLKVLLSASLKKFSFSQQQNEDFLNSLYEAIKQGSTTISQQCLSQEFASFLTSLSVVPCHVLDYINFSFKELSILSTSVLINSSFFETATQLQAENSYLQGKLQKAVTLEAPDPPSAVPILKKHISLQKKQIAVLTELVQKASFSLTDRDVTLLIQDILRGLASLSSLEKEKLKQEYLLQSLELASQSSHALNSSISSQSFRLSELLSSLYSKL